jgi:excisionase family DNA binding protein
MTAHAFRRTTVATTGTLPQLLTIDQRAERLGVGSRHVRRTVAEKRVPYLKVGKFVRFDPAEIATWLDLARVRPPRFGTWTVASRPCRSAVLRPAYRSVRVGQGWRSFARPQQRLIDAGRMIGCGEFEQ